eukprot:scaffold87356_cov14-Tisochrysis_lutea.AAC.1
MSCLAETQSDFWTLASLPVTEQPFLHGAEKLVAASYDTYASHATACPWNSFPTRSAFVLHEEVFVIWDP